MAQNLSRELKTISAITKRLKTIVVMKKPAILPNPGSRAPARAQDLMLRHLLGLSAVLLA